MSLDLERMYRVIGMLILLVYNERLHNNVGYRTQNYASGMVQSDTKTLNTSH